MTGRGNKRTPEEWADEFEEIIDQPDQEPIEFHVEYSPISAEEDVDVIDGPKYRSAEEAYEAWKKEQENRRGHQ
jgi:hypothetical protein